MHLTVRLITKKPSSDQFTNPNEDGVLVQACMKLHTVKQTEYTRAFFV
jgi:hypothetical protein